MTEDFGDVVMEILRDVKYKDWSFYVGSERAGDGGWRHYLQVKFLARDVDSYGASTLEQGRKWWLSEHMTRSEVVQTALKAVLTAEEHEARENFMYRDRRIFGPHIDVDTLWEVCEHTTYREEPT